MRYLLQICVFVGVMLGTSASCVHLSPTSPPTVGFAGTVAPGRDVFCYAEVQQCDYVVHAIDRLNTAAGFRLLRYAGHITADGAARLGSSKRQDFTIVAVAPIPNPSVLGITFTNYSPETSGRNTYARVLVVLDPVIFQEPHAAMAVTLHEIFHSVGACHAAAESPLPSLQKPNYDPELSPELQPGDITALRAAYPVP